MAEEVKVDGDGGGKAPSMGVFDVLAIAACWAGVAAVAYICRDPVVAIVAIVAAGYLAKWVILKTDR